MLKYFACDLLGLPPKDQSFQIKMVERIPITASSIKWNTYMSNSPDGKAAHISEETDFYMVGPQESVIFIQKALVSWTIFYCVINS